MESVINQFVNTLPFELHLMDPIVGKYSACGPGTKHKERIKKYLQTGDVTSLYKNQLDAACFDHDKGYAKHRDVAGRQPYDQKLIEDTEKIIADRSIDGYQRGYASLINKFFSKKIGAGLNRRQESSLKKTYYDPATGYSSIAELHRRTGIPKNDIKEWLESQYTYTRHKPAKTKFRTRKVITGGVFYQLQFDLADMQEFAKVNEGYKYILTGIDVFSKYAFAKPLKNKSGQEVARAFSEIFKRGRVPLKIQTDDGKEFRNKIVQDLFKQHGIHWFSTMNTGKAQIVERFNRTLKGRMYKYFSAENTRRWVDVLDKLVKNYNTSYHTSIKMTPTEALDREGDVRNNLYGIPGDNNKSKSKTKFKVGDRVRISKYKTKFNRGFTPNFTNEIFTVVEVLKTSPVTYKLKDSENEPIIGTFYNEEMSIVRKA